MMNEPRGLLSNDYAGFDAEWRYIPVSSDKAGSALLDAQPAALSTRPGMLRYLTRTDGIYIGHDLPQPIVRDILDSGFGTGNGLRMSWEGIAVGIFLLGYALLGGTVILKIATFGALFAG